MKSDETYRLEEILAVYTLKRGTVGCAEVGLGDEGIVDFITIDTFGSKTVQCYELKISKSDFQSDAKTTFIGEYNYYVVPTVLFDSIKHLIPPGIGCYCVDERGHVSVRKRASRRQCQLSKGYILTRVLLALNREYKKSIVSKWGARSIEKGIIDYGGKPLNIGDMVKYRGELWRVASIEYNIDDDTVIVPYCNLVSTRDAGTMIEANPRAVQKVQ